MTVKHAHLVTRVNASRIKKEDINGEPHYRIPSATLPDDVVMNGGLYPAAEIEAAYKGLEGTPAPLGHPKVGNQFVPARSPHAINNNWIGAWNENVRREGGRVLLDKVVNIRVANQHPEGKKLIEAIEKQEPIHTSTGLQLEIKVANGESKGKPYTWSAHNMEFDHDCFLIGEPGAATPAEGVGVFVNSAGGESEVLHANIDDESIEWLASDIARDAILDQHEAEKNGLMDKIRQAIKSAIGGAQSSQTTTTANANAPEGDMTKEEMISAMNEAMKPFGEKLDALTANQATQGETITQLKANADAAANAEAAKLDEQLKAHGFDEEDLKGMTANAKQKVLAKHQPAQGFHLPAGFAGNQQTENTDTLPE